jgi:hypothetical protein
MAAGTYNTTIDKGSTFSLTVTYKDASDTVVNLTGWTARMQIRETPASASTLLTSTGGSPTITITNTNFATGVILITISATNTATLTVPVAYYDIEVESAAGVVRRIMQGRLSISPEVTR